MVVLASAGGNTVPAIARLVQADEDSVRQVIHRFNEIGMASLDPRWAGGRPRQISLDDEAFIVATANTRPMTLGRPFTRWSIRKLADYLAGNPDRIVAVGRERLTCWSPRGEPIAPPLAAPSTCTTCCAGSVYARSASVPLRPASQGIRCASWPELRCSSTPGPTAPPARRAVTPLRPRWTTPRRDRRHRPRACQARRPSGDDDHGHRRRARPYPHDHRVLPPQSVLPARQSN
jgi:Homeodomain-like domain